MNCASMAPLFPVSLLGSANESPQQEVRREEENGVFISLLPSQLPIVVVAYIAQPKATAPVRVPLHTAALSSSQSPCLPSPLFTPSGPGVVKTSVASPTDSCSALLVS